MHAGRLGRGDGTDFSVLITKKLVCKKTFMHSMREMGEGVEHPG